jgi:hypothetical protein
VRRGALAAQPRDSNVLAHAVTLFDLRAQRSIYSVLIFRVYVFTGGAAFP